MDTIKLTLELTPAQLSRLMLDIRTGADVPREPVTYQPQPASHAWLEEKLAEAEELLRTKDVRLNNLTQTVAGQSTEIDRLKRQISQQASNMEAYKTELEESKRKVRNQCETIRKYQVSTEHAEQSLLNERQRVAERDKRIADQAQTIQTYRLRVGHAEQELNHLRNVCAGFVDDCRANTAAVYERVVDTGSVSESAIRVALYNLDGHFAKLLKEAKRE